MSTPHPGEPANPDTPDSASPQPGRGQFPEIAPGVPRYGQYAPPGYQSPFQQEQANQQQNPGFGSSSGPSAPAGSAVPRQIKSAFALILLAGAIMLVSAVSSAFLANSPEMRAALLNQIKQYPGIDSSGIDISSVITGSIIFAVVLGFVLAGLYALIAFKIRAGRNWARILGTVLAVFSLGFLIAFSPLVLLQVGFGIFGIIYCWLPASRSHFEPKPRVPGNYSGGSGSGLR
ncbi:hypothetical protein [Psychromicrobium sp. YIM B11713]|uniref:hypothetical protein n=1 Tax=Psychromicrobium sp. YIM B11713 TaxID=3145233 RepID=UPI00374E9C9E